MTKEKMNIRTIKRKPNQKQELYIHSCSDHAPVDLSYCTLSQIDHGIWKKETHGVLCHLGLGDEQEGERGKGGSVIGALWHS